MTPKSSYFGYFFIGMIIILGGIGFFITQENKSGENIIMELEDMEIQTARDGTKYLVNPKDIRGGGPPKGGIGVDKGIPALSDENINFDSIGEADKWIEDNELVLVLEHKGAVRIYPLQIMVWHEIANDNLNGLPIAITYCPLCGSGIAYERNIEINGKMFETEFGTSGKLYNSNLVMYDALTDTYWTQIDGLAIVGELTGQKLTSLSIDTVVWRDIKNSEFAKDAEVLNQETGMNRNYGKDPYGGYYEDSFLLFPVENTDDRIFSKTVVFGIEVNGEFKAYRENDLKENPIIVDSVGGIKIRIERSEVGIIKITNQETGEEIVKERDFWFAWYAFHPSTGLYVKG